MSKKNIMVKKNRLKQKYIFDFFKEEEIIDEEISESESENEQKEQENDFYNLVDMLENTKKKDIKKFVKENKDEINLLSSDLKNKLLELIKDKLY
tara:strand:+ start:178 stop:462 length:285 start_codon:yes stop_codon:yes gene_type:complete